MMNNTLNDNIHSHVAHHEDDGKASFGFWLYIMSDCILFGMIFAVYGVLHTETFGGPSGREIFNMPYVLVETFILLISSFTYGLAMLDVHAYKKNRAMIWLLVTFLLGLSFVILEVNEFVHLVNEGNGWQRSAFLASFFTLVGTHGLHVTVGLVWMINLMAQVIKYGLTVTTIKKLSCLSLFWHFLDIVWIFVFTTVYLMGVM